MRLSFMRLSLKLRTLPSCEGNSESLQDLAEKAKALEDLLVESAALFRTYEQSHRQRGPEHLEKAERNADIASRIELLLNKE